MLIYVNAYVSCMILVMLCFGMIWPIGSHYKMISEVSNTVVSLVSYMIGKPKG